MEFLSNLSSYIVPFLIVLTVLVFVHELGHYWVARRCGVKIEVFSIGFGPELFGWNDRAGTRWKVSALPLGGYVKMFGDADAASTPGENVSRMSPEERAVSFHHKSLGQRAAIVAAGPIANFLLAILIYAIVFASAGQPFTPPVVTSIAEDSAALRGGFQVGDRILSVNGTAVERFEDVQQVVQQNLDAPLVIVVRRGGEERTLAVTPTIIEINNRITGRTRIGRLGIGGQQVEFRQHNPATAVWRSVGESWNQATAIFRGLGQIISGQRTTEELGGPLRIAQLSREVYRNGIPALFMLIAVLSINLGVINLFPIPMLDGGHLLFYAAEAIRGRPLNEKAQEFGFRIGLVLVLGLMVYVTWNDLVQLRIVQYVVDLVS